MPVVGGGRSRQALEDGHLADPVTGTQIAQLPTVPGDAYGALDDGEELAAPLPFADQGEALADVELVVDCGGGRGTVAGREPSGDHELRVRLHHVVLLDERGLIPAVRDLCVKFEESTGVRVEVRAANDTMMICVSRCRSDRLTLDL